MPLNITAYVRPSCLKNPTGVGKHQINMINSIARLPNVCLSILAPSDTNTALLEESHPGIPYTLLPYPRRIAEFMWTRFNFNFLDSYVTGDDPWLYFPFEISVKSRRASVASTVHCVNWFEPELPWYNEPGIIYARRSMQNAFRKVIARSNVVLTVSQFLKDRICTLFGADPSDISVVGNGVEEIFIDSPKANPKNNKRILIIAPLIQRKGIDFVLRAAAKLLQTQPDLEMSIVSGAGGHEPYATEAKHLPNVKLLDYMTSRPLSELLADSAMLLILSRYETFGIPALEAMAMGVPVIAADYAGLPEVIGDAGIIVDPNRTDAVCKAIYDLTHNVRLKQDLIALGLKRVADFTWNKCAERTTAALRRKHR